MQSLRRDQPLDVIDGIRHGSLFLQAFTAESG
jgi:hypothetical protein